MVKTAWKVFVLGLKYAISLKNSMLCLFFWSGYSASVGQTTVISVALSSNGCLFSGVKTKIPFAMIDEPALSFSTISKFLRLFSKTIWSPAKLSPSVKLIKPMFPLALTLLTQPASWISFWSNCFGPAGCYTVTRSLLMKKWMF